MSESKSIFAPKTATPKPATVAKIKPGTLNTLDMMNSGWRIRRKGDNIQWMCPGKNVARGTFYSNTLDNPPKDAVALADELGHLQ